MKEIITDFIAAILGIALFLIAFVVILIALPLCLIAIPFVALFTLLFGDDSDDYN